MLSIQNGISNYNKASRNGNSIKYLVIHDVGTKSTAKNNIDYFKGGDRQASAHYFVDDDSIWQSVEDSLSAWHVGDGNGKYGITNQNSIGIEMCLPSGTVSAKTEANTIELAKYIMNKYTIPIDKVVRHYDASRKNCPAQFNLDGKWTRWANFKNTLAGSGSSSNPTPTPTPAPSTGYKTEAWNVKQSVDVDGLRIRTSPNTTSSVIGSLNKGATFTGTKICRNGENVNGYTTWFEVNNRGWVSGAYVTPVKSSSTPTPTPAPSNLKGSSLPNSGSYKFTVNTNIRSGAGTNHSIVGSYNAGQTVNYDSKVVAGGYVWLSYIGASGNRRYVAVV